MWHARIGGAGLNDGDYAWVIERLVGVIERAGLYRRS